MNVRPHRRRAGLTVLAAMLFIALAASRAEAETATEAFEAAWRIEWVDCDPARAIAAYRAILDARNPSSALAAQVRFRMATCHESLGESDTAAALYTALLAVADDPPGTHQRCRKRLARLSGAPESVPTPTASESAKPSPTPSVNDLAAARRRIAELEARIETLEAATPRESLVPADALVTALKEYLNTVELLVASQQFDKAYDHLARGWRRLRAYNGPPSAELELMRAEFDARFILLENELESTGALKVPADRAFRRTSTPDFGRLGIYRLSDLFLPGGGVSADDPVIKPAEFVALMEAFVAGAPYRVIDDVLYVRGTDDVQADTASLVGSLRRSNNRALKLDVDVRAFAHTPFARIPTLSESTTLTDVNGYPVGRVGTLRGEAIGAMELATNDPTAGVARGPRDFNRSERRLLHARAVTFETKSAVPFAGEQVGEVNRRIRMSIRYVQVGPTDDLTVLIDIELQRVDEPVAMVQITAPGNTSRAVQAPAVQTLSIRHRVTLPRLSTRTIGFVALPNAVPPDEQHRRLVIAVTLSDQPQDVKPR
jgi:hypothetical protein